MAWRNLGCAILIVIFAYGLDNYVAADEDLKLVITGSKLPSPRFRARAFYDGGDFIYAIGGYTGSAGVPEVVRYSVDTDSVHIISTIIPFYVGGAVLAGHDIVYFGGRRDNGGGQVVVDQVYRVSTSTGEPTLIGFMPNATGWNEAAWDDATKVGYIFGGRLLTHGSLYSDSVLLYNSTSKEIKEIAQLPEGRSEITSARDDSNGVVYMFGGETRTAGRFDIMKFDPVTATVSQLPAKLPDSAYGSCAVQADGDIYVVGFGQLMKFDRFSEEADTVAVEGWPTYLNFTACAFVPRLNRMYLLGGIGAFQDGSTVRDKIMYVQLGPGSTEPPTTTTTTERPPPVDCSNGQIRVIPNPFCCESFFVCNAGVPVKMECTGNQQFNPNTLQCEDESSVGCRNVYTNVGTSSGMSNFYGFVI